jgi:hypothetical protein
LMEEYNKLHTTNEEQNSTYCYWWNNTGKNTLTLRNLLCCLKHFFLNYKNC